MERDKAKEFYARCILPSMPGLEGYLNTRPTANQVLKAWIDALATCDEQDAQAVLKSIHEAREEMPRPFEFGTEFVRLCRKRKGEREYQEQNRRTLETIGERPKGSAPLVQMSELFAKHWGAILESINAKRISREQGREEWERILSEIFPANAMQS